jgi:hypothetical protein
MSIVGYFHGLDQLEECPFIPTPAAPFEFPTTKSTKIFDAAWESSESISRGLKAFQIRKTSFKQGLP